MLSMIREPETSCNAVALATICFVTALGEPPSGQFAVSATTGLTRVVRNAGMLAATSATRANTPAALTNTPGSCGLTPTRRRASARVSIHAATDPTTMPIPLRTRARPSTSPHDVGLLRA